MTPIEQCETSLDVPRDEEGLATTAVAMKRLERLLPAFLENSVFETGTDGVVVTLDGTLESIVAASLAVDAVGPSRVTGLIMPTELIDEAPARDAEAVAGMLDIESHRLQLHPVLVAFHDVVGTAGQPADDLVALENGTQRFRMVCKYYYSRTTNRLVVGSTTRTDLLLGTTAKYGSGAVDLALFGDLYATEVAAFAEHLDIPFDLVSNPQIRSTHRPDRNADTLGIDQSTFDSLLRKLIDQKKSEATVASQVGVDPSVVQQIKSWYDDAVYERGGPWRPSMVDAISTRPGTDNTANGG